MIGWTSLSRQSHCYLNKDSIVKSCPYKEKVVAREAYPAPDLRLFEYILSE